MILRILLLSLCLVIPSYGRVITITWEHPEESECIGFRLYLQEPEGSNFNVVKDIAGGDLREWKGDVDIVTGENVFALTAYNLETESAYSNTYSLENILEFNTPILFGVIVD